MATGIWKSDQNKKKGKKKCATGEATHLRLLEKEGPLKEGGNKTGPKIMERNRQLPAQIDILISLYLFAQSAVGYRRLVRKESRIGGEEEEAKEMGYATQMSLNIGHE
jgi:hypothetical protein